MRAVGGSRGHRRHAAVALLLHVALTTPTVESIAEVLIDGDGLDPETAHWAASVSGGHVGRARRLATDDQARARRTRALGLARDAATPSRAYAAAEELVKAAEEEAKALTTDRDEVETEELRTALGAGGTGKGAVGALRGSSRRAQELERRQKSRATRAGRDALDRALMDLAYHFRDALMVSSGAGSVTANHPDMEDRAAALAAHAGPDRLLRCIEAVLDLPRCAGGEREAEVRRRRDDRDRRAGFAVRPVALSLASTTSVRALSRPSGRFLVAVRAL